MTDTPHIYPQYEVGQKVLLYDETTKPGENRKIYRTVVRYIDKGLSLWNLVSAQVVQNASMMGYQVVEKVLR